MFFFHPWREKSSHRAGEIQIFTLESHACQSKWMSMLYTFFDDSCKYQHFLSYPQKWQFQIRHPYKGAESTGCLVFSPTRSILMNPILRLNSWFFVVTINWGHSSVSSPTKAAISWVSSHVEEASASTFAQEVGGCSQQGGAPGLRPHGDPSFMLMARLPSGKHTQTMENHHV